MPQDPSSAEDCKKLRLLLISSSRVHSRGYLDHCEAEIRDYLAGVSRVLFAPFAAADHAGYAGRVRERLGKMGFEVDSLHAAEDPFDAIRRSEAIFVGGGNTFRLLNDLYARGLIEPMRARVRAGCPYLGSSAGTNVACLSIKTTNDMPIVYPPSFEALCFVPFNVNPHYLDPDPASTHMGETREERIREFHEMNSPPVVGLREAAILRIEGSSMTLKGTAGARIFMKDQPPREISPGSALDFLLQES
ncbi:MAG TPA: dipeptidase PepE [Candidatus Polarisedimenticolia bacterium]|nr:dipeptidase PepE [Candidatus Polarisedimenticolia bacterium]